jgi:hypothetical protein
MIPSVIENPSRKNIKLYFSLRHALMTSRIGSKYFELKN